MHHMLEEIYEQPDAIKRTVENVPHIEMKNRTIYVVGSGSSYHCGRIFSYMYESSRRRRVIASYSSEFAKHNLSTERDAIFVLSQSGETADAIRAVKATEGVTIAVTNNPDSTLVELSDHALLSHAGKEEAIPSTKTFTSMLAALTLFSMPELENELCEIPVLIEQSMKRCEGLAKSIGENLKDRNIVDILGDGINYPVALEGALKLKETAHMHAQGIPAGDYLHGHISLIGEGYPVIIVCAGDENADLVDRLSSALTYTPVIAFEGSIHSEHEPLLSLPRTSQILSPFLSIPVLQLMAYYSALAKGLDPDKPAGLQKVVED